MKRTILSLSFMLFCFLSFGQTYVSGYYRTDGTYVQGYYKSNTDNTNTNNYSTVGNTNPYTNTTGTVARDYSTQATNYGSGQTIHTGERGGQYYYNSNGNKTYVPKQPTNTYSPVNSNSNSSGSSSKRRSSSNNYYKY